MQRVRMSLPYLKSFGWDASVVIVEDKYADLATDGLLTQSIPPGTRVFRVKAFEKKNTSRFGLGSIALRSLWYYRETVNNILSEEKFDLIFFSTTQFPVCALGPYWKKKFNVPYVIDMQDPWHSDYYRDKPKNQRPPKYWFSYRLNKYLEAIAMKQVDGLISVTEDYITSLRQRYAVLADVPASAITFGAFAEDFKIAAANRDKFTPLLSPQFKNIVYVGRGGSDMHRAIRPVFEALRRGLAEAPDLFRHLKFHFIGTSYAPRGMGVPTIMPLALEYGVSTNIAEMTDRISYYHSLVTLQEAHALFIMGSDDPQYTASKLYPYLFVQKPLLAVFHENSSAVTILNTCTENAALFTFSRETARLAGSIYGLLAKWAGGIFEPATLLEEFGEYSAERLTGNNPLPCKESKRLTN